MKLLIWRSKENLLAADLAVVFFFMPCLVAGRKPANQPFLTTQPSTLWVSNDIFQWLGGPSRRIDVRVHASNKSEPQDNQRPQYLEMNQQ
jgi:hypothetical protein